MKASTAIATGAGNPPPAFAPSLIDTVLVLLGTIVGLVMSPWVMGAVSFETHKDFVRGATAERAALIAFDEKTEAKESQYAALAAAGGDTAAGVALDEYKAHRAAEREPLTAALNEAVESRQTLLSRLRWISLILAFSAMAVTVPAQLGKPIPKRVLFWVGVIASVFSAVWMVCFIPDPNAGNPFHRIMAVLIGLGLGGWGIYIKVKPSDPREVA